MPQRPLVAVVYIQLCFFSEPQRFSREPLHAWAVSDIFRSRLETCSRILKSCWQNVRSFEN